MVDSAMERFKPVGLRIGRAWLGFLFGCAFVGLFLAGPTIENAVDPILGPQTLRDVARSEDRLCWVRESVKYRVAPITNFDTFLDRKNPEGRFDMARRTFPEVFVEAGRPEDEQPLGAATTPKPGDPPRRLCIHLIGVSLSQPIRLQQIAHFRGWHGLWDLPESLPDIVSPPQAG